MKNENSYAELTKAYAMANLQKNEVSIESIYIDTLIQESILKEKRRKYMKKIDEAIDHKDQETFKKLAEELIKINKELNA